MSKDSARSICFYLVLTTIFRDNLRSGISFRTNDWSYWAYSNSFILSTIDYVMHTNHYIRELMVYRDNQINVHSAVRKLSYCPLLRWRGIFRTRKLISWLFNVSFASAWSIIRLRRVDLLFEHVGIGGPSHQRLPYIAYIKQYQLRYRGIHLDYHLQLSKFILSRSSNNMHHLQSLDSSDFMNQ